MPTSEKKPDGRRPALTKERIVDQAISILDTKGGNALTFRSLASALETGHGAIQWHVSNKPELLAAATTTTVRRALETAEPGLPPREAVRAIAIGLFDAIADHPWVGGQLALNQSQKATLLIFEHLGRQLRSLGVPEADQFGATMTLVNYIVGVGSQNALNDQSPEAQGDRQSFLDALAAQWAALDPEEFSFTTTMTEPLRVHDERQDFMTGVDAFLTGMTTQV